MDSSYEVVKIDENTWRIENAIVRFFLLKGSEKTLLIDTGLSVEGVRPLAKEILGDDEIPVEVVLTHADGDHIHGCREFDWFYMHKADIPRFEGNAGKGADIRTIKDGDIIDPGNRPLKVIEIPGHTEGSVALLDINNRVLFAGDSVQDGNFFMFGPGRDIYEFPQSMIKLQEMDEDFDKIYASHGTPELEPDYIGKMFDAAEELLHGELEPAEFEIMGTKVFAYDAGVTTFLIELNRTFPE